ncbi:MAG: hypothetical protein K0R17_4053 [Rariglobus sp.]|jgi:hypothetical protein|nr:hypothetical protein [Rariglobus sp.]
MSSPFTPPPGYLRIKIVQSFEELVSTPLIEGVNALCWPRTLAGDFDEVVARLGTIEEITSLDDDDLRGLMLSEAGRTARDILIEDQRLLREAGLSPTLDCIPGYPRDEESGPVPTDVYSFHADSAPVMADTYLCSYTVASSEGLRNEEALRCADIPETRAELLKQYGGPDDAGFRVFLNEHFFDLHYVAMPAARPFSFGLGNLWRIATDWPGSPVPPCVHRAPATLPGQAPRLLLIS